MNGKTKDIWKTVSILLGILIILLVASMVVLFIFGGGRGRNLEGIKTEKVKLDMESPGEKEMKTVSTIKVSTGGAEVTEESEKENAAQASEPDKPHRYEIISGLRTWSEARTACENAGGYLATITSEEEYNRVLEAVYASDRKVLWLGAQKDEGNMFKWITGEEFSYASWLSGEPNNEGGNENCLVMFSVNGQWVWADVPEDVSAYYTENQVGYICEYNE